MEAVEESRNNRPNIEWFRKGKFGMFIHFGLYSILAGKWKGKECRGIAEWIQNSLDIPLSEYKKLQDEFNPQHLDARYICQLAKDAGMKYLCLTAKHHDGFALWDSKVSKYNSMNSLCKRDIVKEFSEACKDFGLVYCLYYSQAQDWEDPNGYIAYKDENEKKNFRFYLEHKCKPQIEELLRNYGPIGMIWFDTPMQMTYEEALDLKKTVKSIQADCLISGRIGFGLGDYRTTGDNMLPNIASDKLWELPATMNTTWGYKESDNNWRTSKEILEELLFTVSLGGNYLLNIGPDGSGKVPLESVKILRDIGSFLCRNGDSIYATEIQDRYPYYQDKFIVTGKKKCLYLSLFNRLEYKSLEVFNLKNKVKLVKILQSGKKLEFYDGFDLEGHHYLSIDLDRVDVDYPLVIEVEHDGDRAEFEEF